MEQLGQDEDVVRAICSDKYDSQSGRISPSLFRGPNISVSRLSILPLSMQWRVLMATVQKLPGRRLEQLGEINVGRLTELGRSYVANGKPAPVELTVIADPTPQNSAHAVIPENISTGLGKKIIDNLVCHKMPEEMETSLPPLDC